MKFIDGTGKLDRNKNMKAEINSNCLNRIKTLINRVIHGQKGFIEFGGYLIGSFDGVGVHIIDYIYDDKSQATSTRVKFDETAYDKAMLKIESKNKPEDNLYVCGTWHVHPPGFGTQYSSVDEKLLFQERMLIYTDDPNLAVAPKVHLIFDGHTVDFSAYTMDFKSKYNKFEIIRESPVLGYGNLKIEIIADIIYNFLKQHIGRELRREIPKNVICVESESKKLVLNEYNPFTFWDSPDNPNYGDYIVIGFWKHFNYINIPEAFEKIFLENFYHKIKKNRKIIYARIFTGGEINPEIFEVNRETSVFEQQIFFKRVKVEEVNLNSAPNITPKEETQIIRDKVAMKYYTNKQFVNKHEQRINFKI